MDDPHPRPGPPPFRRRLEVSADQLTVVSGRLPLDPALDALVELLVDHWLETRRPDGRQREAVPTAGLQGLLEDADAAGGAA